MPMRSFDSLAEWDAVAEQVHHSEAEAMASVVAAGRTSGYCPLCDREATFTGTTGINPLREGLVCEHCGCCARQRAAGGVLLSTLAEPQRATVYGTEQASRFHVVFRKRVRRLLGSEFKPSLRQRLGLSKWLLRQGVVAWIRNEDATALSMADASLDGIITMDVLEHVPEFRAALSEFTRVLRPGGALALTVPFFEQEPTSVQIARVLPDGRIEHDGEPELHGDPLSGGVVCFHHYAWDLLDAIRAAGFSEVTACRVQGPEWGLPRGLWVILGRR